MALPVARISHLGRIFSPFSGLPIDGKDMDGPNIQDPTLLFVYYANAGMHAYVSQRLMNLSDVDVENTDIDELAGLLSVGGGLILEVDTDWNGLNYYGFAPLE